MPSWPAASVAVGQLKVQQQDISYRLFANFCNVHLLTKAWCCCRMIVVAEDAVQVNPQEVGSLQINNGQRYDVLVCQTPGTQLKLDPVWIRAVMIDSDFQSPSAYNASLGVLYFGNTQPSKLPTSQASYNPPILSPSVPPVPGRVLNPYFLYPLEKVQPPPATKNFNFTIRFYNEPPFVKNATQ